MRLLILLFVCSHMLYAQEVKWGAFDNLIDKTWEAKGKWGDGSDFKQSIHFSFDLNKQIIIANAEGFTNADRTQFGKRNHGIRKYDAELKKFVFWEFDVFGGITQGEVRMEGKDIIYQYEYGGTFLTDKWTYVNDSTYTFTVGQLKDQEWTQKYLEAAFKSTSSDRGPLNTIKDHLIGQWSAKAWDGTLEETWSYTNAQLTQKAVYHEDEKVLYEAQSFMEEKGGELILTTIIKNSNPKIYKATKISAEEIIFENSDYRNPSKVTYHLLDSGFHRTIEGMENGEKSIYTFEFSK